MFGYILHIILVIFGIIVLTTGISLHVSEVNKNQSGTIFIIFFALFAAFTCLGYGLVGIWPDLSTIYIPRFFGFWGIDAFLLTELSYGLIDLKYRRTILYALIGSSTIYALFDLILNDTKSAVIYTQQEFYTTFEPNTSNHLLFHYTFLIVIAICLIILSILWYKSKKTKFEKNFVMKIIFSNYVLLFSGIPYVFQTKTSQLCPAFSFAMGFVFVYFMWYSAIKKIISIDVNVKNISQQIFNSIDVPVIILSLEGKISLSNPYAKEQFKIENEQNTFITDLFSLSDVEQLRLLKKAKNGEDYQLIVREKKSDINYLLKCSVKFDYVGDPFCIICTALSQNKVQENEKGNL